MEPCVCSGGGGVTWGGGGVATASKLWTNWGIQFFGRE
jgi:hypothetical protein